jgi:hypothetical protein
MARHAAKRGEAQVGLQPGGLALVVLDSDFELVERRLFLAPETGRSREATMSS